MDKTRDAAGTTAPRDRIPAKTIAIDGPVACGKSAVGALVARRLGYRFLDTGLMYRALAWFVLERGVDPDDEEAVSRLTREAKVELANAADPDVDASARVLIDGLDATPFLVRPEVEASVSQVSRLPAVREAMVAVQRAEARKGNIVVVGRDIGTVVLTDADLKVYLDASRQERARRRYEQALLRGETISLDSVLADLERRDAIDSGRELSPLRPATDALILNTDGLNLEEVVEKIVALAQ